MAPNDRLTSLLQGLEFASFEELNTTVTVTFMCGHVLRVKGETQNSRPVAAGAKLREVREDEAGMEIVFDQEEPVAVRLANAGHSTSVRDGTGQVVYVD